jgi:hypothetical protein
VAREEVGEGGGHPSHFGPLIDVLNNNKKKRTTDLLTSTGRYMSPP